MPGHWQVGDWALCIKQGPWVGFKHRREQTGGPRTGQVLIVSSVHTVDGTAMLRFAKYPKGYTARRFVKVTPTAVSVAESKRVSV